MFFAGCDLSLSVIIFSGNRAHAETCESSETQQLNISVRSSRFALCLFTRTPC